MSEQFAITRGKLILRGENEISSMKEQYRMNTMRRREIRMSRDKGMIAQWSSKHGCTKGVSWSSEHECMKVFLTAALKPVHEDIFSGAKLVHKGSFLSTAL